MKKLLPILLILMSGTAAHASMSTRHQTSLQLSVDAARSVSYTHLTLPTSDLV